MISLPFAAALSTAILSTSFLSGIFGMAGGFILLGFLLALMPLPAAMVLHGITQTTANGWRAFLWRAHIRWGIVGKYAVGAAFATLIFAAAQITPSKPLVLIMLGLVSLAGLAVPDRLAPNILRPGQAYVCGAICSALQLLAGVSGPVLDVYFARSELDRRSVIATKAAVQMFGHVVKIAYFGRLLIAGEEGVALFAVLLAIVLAVLGTQLSRRVLDAISDRQFRTWTRGLIAVVASVYLTQGVTLLL